MKWIRTIVLVALALILGLWVFYGERHLDDIERKSRPDKRLVRVARDGIDTLTIMTDIDTIKAVSFGDSLWRIIEPVEWRGDPRNWELIVQNLRTSLRERTFLANEDSLRYYTLRYPNGTVVYSFRDKSMPAETLLVGGSTPNDKFGYVRFADSDSVIVTNIAVHQSVLISLHALRYQWIFEDYKQDPITEVRIRRGNDAIRIERQGSRWRMIEPIERYADADTVARFLKTFTDQRVDRFFDHTDREPAFFGLGEPSRAEVILAATSDDDSVRNHHLRIGTLVPALTGPGYIGIWGMDNDRQHSVMKLPMQVLFEIDRETANYWDRRIAMFERRDIDSVAIAGPNGTMRLSRNEQGLWRMWSPREQSVFRARVNHIIADIDMARTVEYTGRRGDISNPRLKIELFGGDSLHAAISFGEFRGDKIYATGSDVDEIVLVNRELYNKLNPTIDEFNEPEPTIRR